MLSEDLSLGSIVVSLMSVLLLWPFEETKLSFRVMSGSATLDRRLGAGAGLADKERPMKSYLFLFRGGMDMAGSSPQQLQANMEKWQGWIGALMKSGNSTGGQPLESSGKVLTGARKVVTDGPFAEAKDVIGGYLLISAESLDHAAELAKGCPIFDHGGTVEVRPIRPM
jgi:hypothetical protein